MLQPTETWLTWAFGFVVSDKHITCTGRPSPRNDECRLLVPDTFSSSQSRVLCERPLIVGLGRTLGLHAPRAQLLYREPSTGIRALAPFLESGSCCRIPIGARATASLRETATGALNLFSIEESPIGERDALVARAFADVATISLLQHGASTKAQQVNEQLSGALGQPRGDRASKGYARRASWHRNHGSVLPAPKLRP